MNTRAHVLGGLLVALMLVVSSLAGVSFELLQTREPLGKLNRRRKRPRVKERIPISFESAATLTHTLKGRKPQFCNEPTFTESERLGCQDELQGLLFELSPHMAFVPCLRRACVCHPQHYLLNPATRYAVLWECGSRYVTIITLPPSPTVHEVAVPTSGLLLEFGQVMI